MELGKFYIGQDFSEVASECREFSPSEYNTLESTMPKETIYHAQDLNFCGASWNSVIGVVDNKIYKISLQNAVQVELGSLFEETLWNKVYEKFNEEIGLYTNQEKKGSMFLTYWDTKWGNIILSSASYEGENMLEMTNVFDIVATGNFAFQKKNALNRIVGIALILAGIVISQLVGDTLALIILIMAGAFIGRKIDRAFEKLILKVILKKALIFTICIFWGSALALWVRVLTLHYTPNLFLTSLCYMSAIYVSNIFYQDKRIGQMVEVFYGTRIKSAVNLITLISYILMSVAFNIGLR